MARNPALVDHLLLCRSCVPSAKPSVWWRRCSPVLASLLLLLTIALPVVAKASTTLPGAVVDQRVSVWVETDRVLTPSEALAAFAQGQFRSVPNGSQAFGIGHAPVWLAVTLHNRATTALPFRLVAATSWIDSVSLSLWQDGTQQAQWHSGDADAEAPFLQPGLGFVFPLTLPAGDSVLLIRAATPDPLVLPLQWIPEGQWSTRLGLLQYSFGFLYGFLAALIIFNVALFFGLRERGHLYYSLYLASFIALSLCYTGHGLGWLWPEAPGVQRFAILLAMVGFSCCGLLFAAEFVGLRRDRPQLARVVAAIALLGLLAICSAVLLDQQYAAVAVAFNFVTLASLLLLMLSVQAVRTGQIGGWYLLAAVAVGALGATVSSLAVWAWLPFHPISYHAVEAGILIEAVLLSLAVAKKVRTEQQHRYAAEFDARHDPLTGVHNRRAFYEVARPLSGLARRSLRPLSVVMLDIDHFKRINDSFGHSAGDEVLRQVAQTLAHACREGDVLARWGGEEFVLLLAETDRQQAVQFAERLRQLLATLPIPVGNVPLQLTCSFGVAALRGDHGIDELILLADQQLLRAKQNGRNRVEAAD